MLVCIGFIEVDALLRGWVHPVDLDLNPPAQMVALVDAVNDVLRSLGHPTYYEDPQPHASVAWVLGEVGRGSVVPARLKTPITFSVNEIRARIGREVFCIPLGNVVCVAGDDSSSDSEGEVTVVAQASRADSQAVGAGAGACQAASGAAAGCAATENVATAAAAAAPAVDADLDASRRHDKSPVTGSPCRPKRTRQAGGGAGRVSDSKLDCKRPRLASR